MNLKDDTMLDDYWLGCRQTNQMYADGSFGWSLNAGVAFTMDLLYDFVFDIYGLLEKKKGGGLPRRIGTPSPRGFKIGI
jgi:hypothetical protein